MIKIVLGLFGILIVAGCSQIKISTTMCDQVAQDPNSQQIPQECRDYNEKEADKAFDKVVDDKKVSKKDIEFVPEK
jgi:hypothetical protein